MYLPFMVLLVALIFRAVAIEFRYHAETPAVRRVWDVTFSMASLLVTFVYGLTVGNAIEGVPLGPGGEVVAGSFNLVRPYPVLVGLFAVITFAMHGAIFVLLRTGGELRRRAMRWAWWAFGLFLALYLLTTAVTLIELPGATSNFGTYPWLWAVPVLNLLAIANLPWSLAHNRPRAAFVSSGATIAAFTCLFGAALYPNLVVSTLGPKFDLTVWKAASSQGRSKSCSWQPGSGCRSCCATWPSRTGSFGSRPAWANWKPETRPKNTSRFIIRLELEKEARRAPDGSGRSG